MPLFKPKPQQELVAHDLHKKILHKGVEEVLPLMRLGDRWKLTIPGNMAFGSKGRPSSAGKPRIQPDATIVFEVEMVGLPGREPELIELIGD